jgi:small subunit ribosomal protein S16
MVRIRLRRTGFRNQPSYRIVAAEKESPRDGKFLENLGSYNPRTDPFTIKVNEERVFHWINNGAQPSESVTQIFNSIGLLDRYKRFKDGEPIEKILEEAKTYYESRIVDSKTRIDKPKAEAKPKAKPEAEAKPEGEAKPKAKPKAETKPEVEVKPKAEAKPKAKPKAEAKPEVEVKPKAEAKTEAKPE